ncbi:MAG: substrate-binding domain-containing protein [Clostridiales bacterium]|nr:substrate-binding domain-containing protein [Clostridiales bacterium]
MKKFLALLLALVMVFALVACGTQPVDEPKEPTEPSEPTGGTIYVLGPTPDHGWTAQAGVYAEQTCAEITEAGTYKATYISASSGEEQVDQINTIIANGDAVGVVMMALEDSAKAGQEALIAEGIPFISFDRIIEGPDASAILNTSGNNWQCGAGIAYWLQEHGMEPGATLLTLIGDNGTVCSRRQEGFEQFLRGELDYYDAAEDEVCHTTTVWTQEQIDALCADYKYVCNWSADGAYEYLEQKLDEIVAAAKANNGSLYIFSQDDEMTFGMLNLLEANAVSEETKADLKDLNVYISAIGGMAELYAVMDGTSDQAVIADTYFDDMMSVYFSPAMFKDAINLMLDYLAGNWDYEVGAGKYIDVWIVDKTNVDQYEGFTGH